MLGKTSVVDLELGMSVYREMNIITVNINNFFELNENKSSEEIFAIKNQLYDGISDIVSKCGAMIDCYTESGLRVLLDSNTDKCIECAIKLEKYITLLCENAEVAIAIQQGDIMYGVTGTEDKAENIVVSKLLNYTHLINNIMETEKITAILTESSYAALSDSAQYNIRHIGKIRCGESTDKMINLYEIFDFYPSERRRLIEANKSKFEKAVELYISGNLFEARKLFVDVIGANRYDVIASSYLFLCDRYMNNTDEDWTGDFKKL